MGPPLNALTSAGLDVDSRPAPLAGAERIAGKLHVVPVRDEDEANGGVADAILRGLEMVAALIVLTVGMPFVLLAAVQSAPLAFLGQSHQSVRLQRAQVVVDFLPSQSDPRGQRRRRSGLGQFGEESTPDGLQGHRRRSRVIDDLDVEHEERVVLTTFVVNATQALSILPTS
jgi:hypothetical protein